MIADVEGGVASCRVWMRCKDTNQWRSLGASSDGELAYIQSGWAERHLSVEGEELIAAKAGALGWSG
ncbi:MAG: hypothetical protein K0R38_5074 [Polyangiaceae bacterium]|nr:hypothetical protein [Polyangiaceae bacterium]